MSASLHGNDISGCRVSLAPAQMRNFSATAQWPGLREINWTSPVVN
jgi:hypothetical protein